MGETRARVHKRPSEEVPINVPLESGRKGDSRHIKITQPFDRRQVTRRGQTPPAVNRWSGDDEPKHRSAGVGGGKIAEHGPLRHVQTRPKRGKEYRIGKTRPRGTGEHVNSEDQSLDLNPRGKNEKRAQNGLGEGNCKTRSREKEIKRKNKGRPTFESR